MDCSGRVLLLGNGGAARAMAFEAAVRQRDLDLTVACRESSQPKAVALAQEVAAFLRERGDRAFRLSIKTYEELEEESLPGHSALGFDLLLNATSVGMYQTPGKVLYRALFCPAAPLCSTQCTTPPRQSF